MSVLLAQPGSRPADEGPTSSILFSSHTSLPAPHGSPTAPPMPISRNNSTKSLHTKRDRRISRNLRPPHSADGSDQPASMPTSGPPGSSTFEGSGAKSGLYNWSMHEQQDHMQRSSHLASPSTSPVRSSRRPTMSEQHRTISGSPSSTHRSPSTLLSLPLFVDCERVRVASSPISPVQESTVAGGQHLVRANSMRESSQASHAHRAWQLPSHHETGGRSDRRHVSPSASMSFLGAESQDTDASWAARTARRWSSSLPRGRNSAALAYRLAEGASPYLRAGLEELRSIFDVDSNPIPSSPFVDHDEDPMHSLYAGRFESSSSDVDSSSLSRQSSLLSTGDGARKLTASPAALSPRDMSPSRASIALQRTPSDELSEEKKMQRCGSSGSGGASPVTTPNGPPPSSFGAWRRNAHRRGESGLSDLRPPSVNRQLLAWSLSSIAVGVVIMCAWGYAMQSDTFSPTLIGFYLTQPAFALAALVALLLRNRAWMDLFSRAMRAHVLAQALIVLLAYLDLSASSLYASSSSSSQNHSEHHPAGRFRLVPTMEMRFGPLHRATEAGDGPGVDLLQKAAHLIIDAQSRTPSAIGHGEKGTTISSVHAHDTAVGDWRSRLTHLIVFIVQAAAPIIMALVGQYIVAQRLAFLARQGMLSRQNSLRQDSKSAQTLHAGNVAVNGTRSHSPPTYVPGTLLATHQPLSVGTHRPVPRLNIPTQHVFESHNVPSLRLPGDSPVAGAHPRLRREDRRTRLATAPGVSVQADRAALTGQDRLEDKHEPKQDRRRTHRHHRSASHPVNLVDNVVLPSKGSAGLGMTF